MNGAIKCQQIAGGDGFATMGDGTQTYLFSFGPLSGLADMAAGKPGTQFPSVFNTTLQRIRSCCPVIPPPPITSPISQADSPGRHRRYSPTFNYNGAVGLAPDCDTMTTALPP